MPLKFEDREEASSPAPAKPGPAKAVPPGPQGLSSEQIAAAVPEVMANPAVAGLIDSLQHKDESALRDLDTNLQLVYAQLLHATYGLDLIMSQSPKPVKDAWAASRAKLDARRKKVLESAK